MSETRWDQSVFDRTLADYMKISTRTLAEIVNNKAYYVARKALWFTRKADAGSIRSSLGEIRRRGQVVKSARGSLISYRFTIKTTHLQLHDSNRYADVPLAALLVQSKAAKAGRRSPWFGRNRAAGAAAMTAAIRNLIVARLRSVAYLKSGWLPSIKLFGSAVADKSGLPPIEGKQTGRPKGRGEKAKPGFIVRASIENFARTIKDPRYEALTRHGAPALQRAFDDEAQSMREYIERKMKGDADAFNQGQKGG